MTSSKRLGPFAHSHNLTAVIATVGVFFACAIGGCSSDAAPSPDPEPAPLGDPTPQNPASGANGDVKTTATPNQCSGNCVGACNICRRYGTLKPGPCSVCESCPPGC